MKKTDRFFSWWRWRDSNSWPPACKAGALPTELHPHVTFKNLLQSFLCFKQSFFYFLWQKSAYRLFTLRKEVIQPHLPIRLPCYDFTPVTDPTFDCCVLKGSLTGFGYCQLPWCDGRCVQDPGTHSPQHSDLRLLVTPASCRRVSAYNPNWEWL